jgi:hypothetical protein
VNVGSNNYRLNFTARDLQQNTDPVQVLDTTGVQAMFAPAMDQQVSSKSLAVAVNPRTGGFSASGDIAPLPASQNGSSTIVYPARVQTATAVPVPHNDAELVAVGLSVYDQAPGS